VADCTLGGADTCDLGGEPHDGILLVANEQQGQINTEAEYPYVSGGSGKLTRCRKPKGGVATGITGYANVTHGDEQALAQAVSQHPIISVGIDASSIMFQFYDSGIYSDNSCKNGMNQLDHGVAVVGYGSGSPAPPGPTPPPPGPQSCMKQFYKSPCTKIEGCHWCTDSHGLEYCFNEPCPPTEVAMSGSGDYWMVKNSWGTDWGMGGYIAMSRNSNNQCGIATDAVFAIDGK